MPKKLFNAEKNILGFRDDGANSQLFKETGQDAQKFKTY